MNKGHGKLVDMYKHNAKHNSFSAHLNDPMSSHIAAYAIEIDERGKPYIRMLKQFPAIPEEETEELVNDFHTYVNHNRAHTHATGDAR